MATKYKLMKLLQEVRGLAELTRRTPTQKNPPLFLMQLRSHLTDASRPRHRLIISMDIGESAHFPHPVKITHLRTDTGV